MFIKIPGYEVIKVIYEGPKSTIYQAVKLTNDNDIVKVIIKALRPEFNTPKQVAALQHEAAITKKINSPYVNKTIELLQTENSWALVQEDFNAQPLITFLKEKKLDLKTVLIIGIGIAKGIADIHKSYVIHKDIKPQNIVVNLTSKVIKIIDFGISTALSKEVQSIVNPEALEGSLAYISPEQTGRMNRAIDYRTDIYSLGITLYEMLTGVLPFYSEDFVELVYMHIARPLVLPHERDPSIPRTLSEIVAKCLQKDPEDRYFSVLGVINDLENCLQQLEEKSQIDFFLPGGHDVYDRFSIPQKLYGREKELEYLGKLYGKVFDKPTFLFLAGYPGIGRSSLIMEMPKKGQFIVGKFEEAKKNTPLSGFIAAFDNLVNILLSESNENLLKWKEAISNELGQNIKLLVNLVPDLELITGKLDEQEQIDFADAEKRAVATIIDFLKLFLKNAEQPLTIFLDDLQSADYSSLKLLQAIAAEDSIENLLIICSYRSNEVETGHPFYELMQAIAKENVYIEHFEVVPLSIQSIKELVADLLHTHLENAFPLANLVYKKTQGNPYFVEQFLSELYNEGLIYFNPESHFWESNLSAIQHVEVTENVADLIGKKLKKLSFEAKEVLKIASALGSTFEMLPLSILSGKPMPKLISCIQEAIENECIIPLESYYSLEVMSQVDLEKINPKFKFQHSRIHKEAYKLITEWEMNELHINIGKLFLKLLPEKKKQEMLIEIVDHLNYGRQMIYNDQEIMELVKLNQLAGQQAMAAIAYPAAENYYRIALSLLGENSWRFHYPITMAIHQELAMSVHLAERPGEALKILDEALRNAKTNMEKAYICFLQMEPAVTFGIIRDALDKGKEALKYLDIPQFDMSHGRVIFEILKIKLRLAFINVDDIPKWPEATDEKTKLLSTIFSHMATYGFYVTTNEFAVMVVRTLKMTLKKGITAASITAFMGYTLSMLNRPLYQFKQGYKLGKIIFELGMKYITDRAVFTSRLLFLTRIARYGESHDKVIPRLMDQLKIGSQYGHLWVSKGPIYYAYSVFTFFNGENLEVIKKDISENIFKFIRASVTGFVYFSLRWRQICRVLTCEVADFADESFYKWGPYPEVFASVTIKEKDVPHVIFGDAMAYIILEYYQKDYDKVVERYYDVIKKYTGFFPGDFNWILVYFYSALALAKKLKKNYNKKDMKQLLNIRKYFIKSDDAYSTNFKHMLDLISAEIEFVKGDTERAYTICQEALKAAKEAHNPSLEAIGYEQCAAYYQVQKKELEVAFYIKNAYECYAKWGATLKLRQMEKDYPNICMGLSHAPIRPKDATFTTLSISITHSNTLSTTLANKNELAMHTFIKSAQALSEEIQLDKLVTKLMSLVMMEAGAEKAYLILNKDGTLLLEAEIFQNEENAHLLNGIPLNQKADEISLSVIQYVERTMKQVILEDANKESLFSRDPYIAHKKVNSILCMPLIYQSKLTGVLYLENSLIKGAFTKESCSLLNLLSTQIAISIENARFYGMLEEKVEKRTQELSQKNIELGETLEILRNTQDQLVESEKLAALGEMIAGIAHEVNTPIGAVQASAENARIAIRSLLNAFGQTIGKMDDTKIEHFSQLIELCKTKQLNNRLGSKEERQIKKDLIKTYEEANIPEADETAELLADMGLYDNLTALLKGLGKDSSNLINLAYNINSIKRNNKNILMAVENAAKIIIALKSYIRKEDMHNLEHTSISEGIETVLTLYHHSLKHDIKVIKEFQNIHFVLCKPNELNQVWTNLINNAIQSMEQKGILKIEIFEKDTQAVVQFTDSGPGIPKEIQDKLFTPFFTTKPRGQGTGLGLMICKKIVESYGGKIEFESKPQETVFRVYLPLVLEGAKEVERR